MKREFHIGPGAASLILIVVVLSMSVLSVLALTNARSDVRLSARSASVIESLAKLNAEAERSLAQLDAVLQQSRDKAEDDSDYLKVVEENLLSDMSLSGNEVSWTVSDEDQRKLYCAVEVLSMDAKERFQWKEHRVSSEFAEMKLEEIWN